MNSQKKVAEFLDKLSETLGDTFHHARKVEDMMEVFPEVDWQKELEAAADRQVAKYPDANAMDCLADYMSSKFRKQSRKVRRGS